MFMTTSWWQEGARKDGDASGRVTEVGRQGDGIYPYCHRTGMYARGLEVDPEHVVRYSMYDASLWSCASSQVGAHTGVTV